MTQVYTGYMNVEIFLVASALAFFGKLIGYTAAACFVVRYTVNQIKARGKE